jgi:hypothetical protein
MRVASDDDHAASILTLNVSCEEVEEEINALLSLRSG